MRRLPICLLAHCPSSRSDAERDFPALMKTPKHIHKLPEAVRVAWLGNDLCLLYRKRGLLVVENDVVDLESMITFLDPEVDTGEEADGAVYSLANNKVFVLREFRESNNVHCSVFDSDVGFAWWWKTPFECPFWDPPLELNESQFAFSTTASIFVIDWRTRDIIHRFDHPDQLEEFGFGAMCKLNSTLIAAEHGRETTRMVAWDLNEASPASEVIHEFSHAVVQGACPIAGDNSLVFTVSSEMDEDSINVLRDGLWESFKVSCETLDRSNPIFASERLYFFSLSGTLMSVDLNKHTVVDEHKFSSQSFDHSFNPQLSKLAVTTTAGDLYTLDL